jgi:hypothetical protein
MKIAFVNVLHDIDPAYSISTVLLSHIRMAMAQGQEAVLITTVESKVTIEDTGCEVRKVMPIFTLKDYVRGMIMEPEHLALVDEIEKTMREATADCDKIVCHDLVLQGWYAPYGLASVRLGKVSHVIHSQPCNQFVESVGEGRIIVLNDKLVEQAKYAYKTQDVVVVPNAVDICEFLGFKDKTKEWIKLWKLDECDYIFTYPLCATRWAAKGVDWLALFTKYMNNKGYKTALVLLLSHANKEQQFTFDTCHFSNVMFEDFKGGVPHEMVRDFMLYSDGFMLPSTSETSSLVYMEAALAKNPVFLNEILNLPAKCENANMADTSDANFESILNRFLEHSKPWTEFRRLRKEMNEGAIGKLLCSSI